MRRDILEIDHRVSTRYPRDLSQMDAESIRLLLSGSSVIDWQRLAFEDLAQVDAFLVRHRIDVADAEDRLRLRYVYNESVSYLEEHLRIRFPPELRDPDDVREVFLWASQEGGFRRTQILSCVILKLVHVIHHMEAADLKFRTPIPEASFFEMAHQSMLEAAQQMREAGLPVVSFYGNHKSRSSVITKLLAKRETLAATIFDKLRFRIVVEGHEDLVPTLAWIMRNVTPFNYVIPGQSHNNLLDPAVLGAYLAKPEAVPVGDDADPGLASTGKNEFSGSTYRMINFICDYPVRIPQEHPGRFGFELGRVVFVMIEFQLLDRETSRRNEEGDNAHTLYKDRQHEVVARRLKRGANFRRSGR